MGSGLEDLMRFELVSPCDDERIAQCETNSFPCHTNQADVTGVRGQCASCKGLNQPFKQQIANDIIINTV